MSNINFGSQRVVILIATRIKRIEQIMTDLLHADITDKVLKAYYAVYNKLGFGFL